MGAHSQASVADRRLIRPHVALEIEAFGSAMTTKKRISAPSVRRKILRLEQKLKGVEAQIARLEKDKTLDLAMRDQFLLWKRPNLFASRPSKVPH